MRRRLGRPLSPLVVTEAQREVLAGYCRRRKTASGLALRASIVLACADGPSKQSVAAKLRVKDATVGKWRRRFIEAGLDGLLDEPRPDAPRKISDAEVERVVTLTLETTPRGATHWSMRDLAREVGCGWSRSRAICSCSRIGVRTG